MRNLKKILALVLALVMSFSLMATAGAESFQDVKDDNPYKTAIDVLTELKVVKGYGDGNFQPDGQLNRAEAAVLVYRIATGDVEDKYLDNYTFMQQSKFEDLDGYNWAKGYINYCQNAGIVVGTDATHFNPGGKVTGYQLLVMLLRTLGYGKAGEFADPKGWELQTAAIAEREGILKNVTTGDLGAPAPRAMVAEILFRGLLTDTVTYSALTSGGYTKGQTLGMREFKLEQIQGVVTGNEFADLKSTQVLDNGMTQLETEDGLRDLAISTEITDIGESRYAYITGTKVLAMGDTGLNKVTETGAATNISTATLFRSTAEMPAAAGIEYYINFGRTGTFTCDQRLEFVVTFNWRLGLVSPSTGRALNNLAALIRDFEDTYVGGADLRTDVGMNVVNGAEPETVPASATVTYSKIIRAEADISDEDLSVIRGIFAAADNNNTTATDYEGVEGDVFVGTYSNGTGVGATADERDLSNRISYKKFVEDYINDEVFDINWNTSNNGDWVKFVDNNGDGQAEYAFRTISGLDEALETYTNKAGDTVTQFNQFNDDATNITNGWQPAVRYMDGNTPAVGDKVIAALIDNQWLVEPVNSETKTVTDYNWRDDQIKTSDGDTYGQSGIRNWTDMQELISTMADGTEYVVYFDHFGYVRAYEIPGGTQYALVTEIYARNNANGNLQQNWPMTVELVVKDADAAEYGLNGNNRSPFVSAYDWTQISNYSAVGNYYNYLQPATAHYGVSTQGLAPVLSVPTLNRNQQYTFWSRNRQVVNQITALTAGDVFDYGAATVNGVANNNTVSFTNIAIANISGENATLTGAAQVRRDTLGNVLVRPGTDTNGDGIWNAAGERARYAVDYVQLTTDNTVKGQTRYSIDPNYTGWQGANGNNYVSATHNTEYYIVYNHDVLYFTDYANMPALTAKDNNIRAAYAVARETSADNATQPYWVADVIVYEIEKYVDTTKTSTALVYYNPSRNDNQVQLLNTLDSANGLINAVPDPLTWSSDDVRSQNFGPSYAGYDFYQFWDGEKQENGDLAVSNIVRIDGVDHRAAGGADLRWNSNLIYAGTVVNEVEVATNGTYLNVDTDNDGQTNVSLLIKDSAESNVYSVTTDRELGSRWNYNEAAALRYSNVRSSEIKAGDRLVWVGGSAIKVQESNNTQTASFVVDLGNDLTTGERANAPLKWLTANFLLEQNRDNNTVGAISAVSTGLWQKIMAEQTAAVPAAALPTITFFGKAFTYTAASNVIDEDVTYVQARDNDKAADKDISVKGGKLVVWNGANVTDATNFNLTVNKTTKQTYTGTILGDDGKYYTFTLEQLPATVWAVDLYSTNTAIVQVANGTDGADKNIIVDDNSLAVDTVVKKLADKNGAKLTGYQAWDSARITKVQPNQTIVGAGWIDLTFTNANGETKTITVQNVGNTGWDANKARMVTITIDPTKVSAYTRFVSETDCDPVNMKTTTTFEVPATDPAQSIIFIAKGEGDWTVETGSVGSGTTYGGGSARYFEKSGLNALSQYVMTYEATGLFVTFTPKAAGADQQAAIKKFLEDPGLIVTVPASTEDGTTDMILKAIRDAVEAKFGAGKGALISNVGGTTTAIAGPGVPAAGATGTAYKLVTVDVSNTATPATTVSATVNSVTYTHLYTEAEIKAEVLDEFDTATTDDVSIGTPATGAKAGTHLTGLIKAKIAAALTGVAADDVTISNLVCPSAPTVTVDSAASELAVGQKWSFAWSITYHGKTITGSELATLKA